jgi:outer membrane lipoprotein-sorting protein
MVTTPGGSRARVLLAVVVVAALAVGGGLLLTGETSLPSGEEAAQQYGSLDAYNATYVVTYDEPNGTRTVRVRNTVSPDSGELRAEVLEPPSRAGNLRVYNGSVTWLYNATRNSVTRVTQPDPQVVPQQQALIHSLVAGANGDGPSSRISPLPVVPAGGAGSPVENATGELTVSYDGTATVAGRDAHVLVLTPVEEADTVIRNQTVWLDTERFIPLKSRAVLQFGDDRTVVSQETTAVAVGPDLPPGAFEFTPPAGARSEGTAAVTEYGSRAALRNATAFPVPDPTVPDRFELSGARLVVRPDRTAAVLRYTSGVNVISVLAGNGSEYDNVTGEPVAIGNRTGRFSVSGQVGQVVWSCGPYEYSVAGTVSKGTLTEVASSVAARAGACNGSTARTASR